MLYTKLKNRLMQECIKVDENTLFHAKQILMSVLMEGIDLGVIEPISINLFDQIKFVVEDGVLQEANTQTFNFIKLLQSNEVIGLK